MGIPSLLFCAGPMYSFSQYPHRVAYSRCLFIEWIIGPMVETQFSFNPYTQQVIIENLIVGQALWGIRTEWAQFCISLFFLKIFWVYSSFNFENTIIIEFFRKIIASSEYIIVVLHLFSATYKMFSVSILRRPRESLDTEHHTWGDTCHSHVLPHCNGFVFPSLDKAHWFYLVHFILFYFLSLG